MANPKRTHGGSATQDVFLMRIALVFVLVCLLVSIIFGIYYYLESGGLEGRLEAAESQARQAEGFGHMHRLFQRVVSELQRLARKNPDVENLIEHFRKDLDKNNLLDQSRGVPVYQP